ncbi:hypothetical protein [Microbacterium sp. GXF6406]
MTSSRRVLASAWALLAASALIVGCTASPGDSAPTSSADPDGGTAGIAVDGDDMDDVEAAWLDNGNMVAVLTWGSSSCVPVAGDVTADGQTVRVTLDEGDPAAACTSDLAPRATLVDLPEGVDPTRDVEIIVNLGERTDDVDLDGNAALTRASSDFQPTAGWFDDDALALLTWGSSSCPPVIDSIEAAGNAGTVRFADEDGACTRDMAPRVTLIGFDDIDDDDDDAFVLTLVGGGLDGEVTVIEN